MNCAYFLVGLGVGMLLLGVWLMGPFRVPPGWWWTLIGGLGVLQFGVWLEKFGSRWMRDWRLRQSEQPISPLAETLTPQLLGDYTPYVLDAAKELGAARDTTAVPVLLYVLESCVDAQRPGWRDVAEAIAKALMVIGDRRALPLLYRLENVRGIGFIPSIREAIAAIEPQTSLLRPGDADGSCPETLLRPAHSYPGENDPALLLRAAPDKD